MKFNVTCTFSYEIRDDLLLEYYGTADPVECAKIDAAGDLDAIMCAAHNVKIAVIPELAPA